MRKRKYVVTGNKLTGHMFRIGEIVETSGTPDDDGDLRCRRVGELEENWVHWDDLLLIRDAPVNIRAQLKEQLSVGDLVLLAEGTAIIITAIAPSDTSAMTVRCAKEGWIHNSRLEGFKVYVEKESI